MSSVAILPVRKPVVPSNVLGMLIFVVTEVMFFAAFISAFVIVRSRSFVAWPPPDQPRLPIEATAVNTLGLLASGLLLLVAFRAFKRDEARARPLLLASLALGTSFVVVQGIEWVALIREGLTLNTSPHASFFYLIVGAHALHAICALILLGRAYVRLRKSVLTVHSLQTALVFWTFVVGVWPALYVLVYLGGGA